MFDGLSGARKTDNAALGPKLAIRRHFLRRYHADASPRVFDACQATGVLWRRLRGEFEVTRYWGVDKHAKRGRLAVDSARILAQPGWLFDMIDVDTYGSPWSHWSGILANMPHPVTVFLTIGWAGGVKPMDLTAMDAIGLGQLARQLRARAGQLPPSLIWKVNDRAIDYCLALALTLGRTVVEAGRVQSRSAYYYGLRLAP